MVWFILHIILSIGLLWPVEEFTRADLGKPMIFVPVFAAIFTILWFISRLFSRTYFLKPLRLMKFIFFFIRETVKSNLRVAYDIITPGFITKPAIIAVPLDITSDNEIITLASAITLTPGTLALEISKDKKTMYVHEMYVPGNDPEAVRNNIKEGFERMIIELAE